MRHTPGPWTIRHTDELNAAIHADEYGVIADVNLCRDDGTANAQLIKAAPNLLATCEDVLHQLATDSDLETITGAAKYERLTARLREVIDAAARLTANTK